MLSAVLGVITLMYSWIREPYRYIESAFEQMEGNRGDIYIERIVLDTGEYIDVALEHSC